MLKIVSITYITLTVLFFEIQKGYGQVIDYVGISGGMGSYTNTYDTALLNYFNPRRVGPEANVFVGRQRKQVGWQTGLTYRDVRYFTLIQSKGPNLTDTARNDSNTGFLLIPLYLTYQIHRSQWKVGLRAGLYGGWKLYASETITFSTGTPYVLPVQWTRFPMLDAFGGQAGLECSYVLNKRMELYMEGRLIKDASSLIFPDYHTYTNVYAGYEGRAFNLGVKYNLQ